MLDSMTSGHKIMPTPSHADERLIRLLTSHQERLFRYIFALVPCREDALDVLQETCVALCRKFHEYDADRPFIAWAYGFAYREVLKQRERARRQIMPLSPDVIELLAQDRTAVESMLDVRLEALGRCLERLPPRDRTLLDRRYASRIHMDELAEQIGMSRRTLFRNLERIRHVLFDCVSSRLAAEGLP